MAAIHNLCNKSMLLEKGEISVIGLTDQIIHHYATDSNHIPEKLIQVTQRKGNGKARFVDLLIKDESGRIVEQAVSGSSISIIMKYHSTVGLLKNCRISIAFYDNNGQVLFNCSSELTNKEVIILPPDGYIRCDIPKFPLSQGEYIISPFLESNREIIDWIIDGIKLDVIDGDFYGSGKLYPDGWQGKGVLVNHIWSCSNSI
jgi:lipopolysaccharide transport system ATP-binding protein